MKLRNIFFAIVSALLVFAGCVKEEPTSLAEISLDKTYISIPAAGGDAVMTVTATENWNFIKDLPAWLTASAVSGGQGETKVTFHAGATEGGREQEIQIQCGTNIQYCIVRQGSFEVFPATIAEALAAPDGKNFKLTGAIVEWYSNAEQYGNYYIEDETGRILIYGTADKDGKFKNYPVKSWGLELGDVVTIEGPRGNYKGDPQMVDVVITKLVKSLLKIDVNEVSAPVEGMEFTVKAAYKGNGVFVSPGAEWISLQGMDYVQGVATKLVPNPADTAVITFKVLPNEGDARKAVVEISSASGKDASTQTVTVSQSGSDVTVSQIIAANKGDVVKSKSSLVVARTTKGFVISDGEKAVYVYDNGANAVAVGDMVVIKGSKTTYNGVPEVEKVSEVTVQSSGNAVTYPMAQAVNGHALTYKPAEAEYITIYGKLKLSGNYYNVELEGVDKAVKMGSIVYPAAELDAASFADKDIMITGYFNGLSGSDKYLNVIATSIKEYTAGAPGTVTNPYKASDIAALLGGGTKVNDPVYVVGKVSKVQSPFSVEYGTSIFWISDDGEFKNDPVKDFEAYSVWYLGAKTWVEGYGNIAVGDEVVLYGNVTYYAKNKVAETSSKKAYVYSINGSVK
ncbi:MAG: hypothetical protein J5699_09390 [Bacteroidales bacterium]|nr:hypothetical protein [Bacteroidales bacterium]